MRGGMFGLGLVVMTLGGCGNPCVSVCDQMAAFAQDCGLTVTNNEIDECYATQADQGRDQRRICRDFGDRASIEQSWDCTEIARYYSDQSIGDDSR